MPKTIEQYRRFLKSISFPSLSQKNLEIMAYGNPIIAKRGIDKGKKIGTNWLGNKRINKVKAEFIDGIKPVSVWIALRAIKIRKFLEEDKDGN